MGRIYAIALNTFREAVRSKILYAILFFAILLIMSSLALAELSLYEQDRVIKDLSVVTVTLFSVIIAIFTGVSLLYKEIEKKTIYTIVSKPIERWHFLIGKFGGIVMTIAVELAIMVAIVLILLAFRGITPSVTLMQALLLIFFEVVLVGAMAIFFSSFSTPFVSGMLTALLFASGHVYNAIESLALDHSVGFVRGLMQVGLWLLPDLTLFNLSMYVTHNVSVPWSQVGLAILYGSVYTTLLLLGAIVGFQRRDLI